MTEDSFPDWKTRVVRPIRRRRAFACNHVLFVIRHGRRDIAHWNITEHPSAQWVTQQLREAFPYDSASRYLVFDRDAIFSADVARVVDGSRGLRRIDSMGSPPLGRWMLGVRAHDQ